jgi:hypothetical protein
MPKSNDVSRGERRPVSCLSAGLVSTDWQMSTSVWNAFDGDDGFSL